MIPVTYPSSVSTSKESQMVVFALSSVAGLQRWTDYIPVKFQSTGTANSFNTGGYLACDFLSTSTNKQAWVDYIPVYVDSTATDAWQVSATGFIPFNTLPGGGLGSSLDFNFAATGTLDASITFTRASTATFVGSNGLIQSAAIDTPRFDYDPVTLAAKGLLIEQSRANLFSYSEDFQTTAEAGSTRPWLNAATNITVNALSAPDATTTADLIIADTTSALHGRRQGYTGTTSVFYSYTVYVKQGAGNNVVALAFGSSSTTPSWNSANRGHARFNLSTKTVEFFGGQGAASVSAASSITDVGNGWLRCLMIFLPDGTGADTNFAVGHVSLPSGQSADIAWAGDNTSGAYFWGAQLEVGDFPTSYIPTTTTSLTRSEDVAKVNTISPWFNATEGTLYAQATVPSAQLIGRAIASIARSTSTTFEITVNLSRASDNRRIAAVIDLTTQFQYAPIGAITSTKGAVAYKENNSQGAFEGTASPVDTTCTIPTALTTMYIGNLDSANANLNGHIQRITYYPRRLSQAELESITA